MTAIRELTSLMQYLPVGQSACAVHRVGTTGGAGGSAQKGSAAVHAQAVLSFGQQVGHSSPGFFFSGAFPSSQNPSFMKQSQSWSARSQHLCSTLEQSVQDGGW